jgi:hypothetical protein
VTVQDVPAADPRIEQRRAPGEEPPRKLFHPSDIGRPEQAAQQAPDLPGVVLPPSPERVTAALLADRRPARRRRVLRCEYPCDLAHRGVNGLAPAAGWPAVPGGCTGEVQDASTITNSPSPSSNPARRSNSP